MDFVREIFADAQCFSTGSGRSERYCVTRRARRWRFRDIREVMRDEGDVEMYLEYRLAHWQYMTVVEERGELTARM